MYIILVFTNESKHLYLQKDKKVVDYISEDAIFDVYSAAMTASKCLVTRSEVYPLKDFILSNTETLDKSLDYKFAEHSA